MEILYNENVGLISNLDWALYYLDQGWSVIPLYEADKDGNCSCRKSKCTSVGKHPRVKNGLKDGSSDPSVIKAWWNLWPDANIGIVTGSASKICVIDVDPKNGGYESLAIIEDQYGILDGSLVRTGGNGKHFYFSTFDQTIKSHVNLYPGIDIRGDGGYIVAPPSRHKSGHTYQWEKMPLELSTSPDFLKNLKSLRDRKLIDSPSGNKVVEGSRNSFLASISGYLLKQGVQYSAIEEVLMVINQSSCNPLLPIEEVRLIAKSIQRYKEEAWPDLGDIREPEVHVLEMSHDLLPDNLKDWILDITSRMQIPIDFIAIPVIVGISALIGRKFRVYPKKNDDWIVVPNLWGGIVSRPGTLKSPAIAEALKPLESIVKRENAKYTDEIAEWEINQTINHATSEAFKDHLIRAIKKGNLDEAEAFKSRMKKNQNESSKRKPAPKRLKTNDTTVEKLVELLLDNPNGLLIIRDELSGWLMSLNKQGRESDRPFYLESWNGYGSYTVDRIGRGTVHVPALCLSILGGIQPDKLEKMITQSLSGNDDGLLQRFQLLVCPSIKKEWSNNDTAPNIGAEQFVTRLLERLYDVQLPSIEDFIGIHFDSHAQTIFDEWREQLEILLRSNTIDNISYESHLAKYRSLVPSLALIFQLIATGPESGSIDKKNLQMAIQWCDFLQEHARKIYQVSCREGNSSIKALQKKILDGRVKDEDSVRSILRNGWEYLSDMNQIEKALNFLEQHSWLRVIETGSVVGRRSKVIRLHPDLRNFS